MSIRLPTETDLHNIKDKREKLSVNENEQCHQITHWNRHIILRTKRKVKCEWKWAMPSDYPLKQTYIILSSKRKVKCE